MSDPLPNRQPKRRGRPPLAPGQQRVKYDARLLPEDVALLRELGTEWLEQQLARERRRRQRAAVSYGTCFSYLR